MKTDKELLELLLINVKHYMIGLDKFNSSGLCSVIKSLCIDDIISYHERTILDKLIVSFEHPIYRFHQGFWWVPGQAKPRIEWLKTILKEHYE